MPLRQALDNVLGADDPVYEALTDLNRLYHRRLLTRSYNTAGIDLLAEEWDNLVILDACRYDLFEDRHTLPGRLESRVSRGSNTLEFLTANLAGRTLHDTVYVTAQVQFHRHRDQIGATFHDEVNVWADPENLWRGHTPTAHTTTEHAIGAAERYPDKRLLVHYTQPHYPFIDAENPAFDTSENVWVAFRRGEIDATRAELFEAYARNFTRTLPHVERLLTALDGRTVVTSDHGNMVGERSFPLPVRTFGHPHATYTPELVRVPWLVHQDGSRKTVVAAEPATDRERVDEGVVADRLESLGYTA